MSRRALIVDVAVAALVAVVVLALVDGLAVAALIAILTLLVCGVSFAFEGRRAGSRRRSSRPPRRSSRSR